MHAGSDSGSAYYQLRSLFVEGLLLAPGGTSASEFTELRRRIAMALLWRTNEAHFIRTGELVAWIGADNLAAAMLCDRRTVQRSLRYLLDHGLLEVAKKGGGAGRSTHYRFSTRWLVHTEGVIRERGIAKAYGIRGDLLDAYNGRFASLADAEDRQNCGRYTADFDSNGGVNLQNRGTVAGEPSHVDGDDQQYSGTTTPQFDDADDVICGAMTAVTGENCGKFEAAPTETAACPRSGDLQTAASLGENCGAKAGNCGAIVPPESLKPIKPINAPVAKTAATPGRRRAGPPPQDLRQGHIPLVFPGGLSGTPPAHATSPPRSTASLTLASGPASQPRNPRALERLIERATAMLGGDADTARTAVAWLSESQRSGVANGLRPSDEDLAKWLDWALHDAASAERFGSQRPDGRNGGGGVETPPGGRGGNEQEGQEEAPPTVPEDRLCQVERVALDTAAQVQALAATVDRLVTSLAPLLQAALPPASKADAA